MISMEIKMSRHGAGNRWRWCYFMHEEDCTSERVLSDVGKWESF